MRVLLIDDDPKVGESLALAFSKQGMTCDVVGLGEEGLQISQQAKIQKQYEYDIIILDLLLPDSDGFEILLRIRSAQINTPVLILSGLGTHDQKIKGLGYGADDYLTKPFNRAELLARVQAIVRRSKGYSESQIRFGRVCLSLDTRTVEVNNRIVHLTSKEYGILELLALRKGHILTKEMFLNHLYNGYDEPEVKIIDVFVCKLRKKLAEASSGENYIQTVWGVGYKLLEFAEAAGENPQEAGDAKVVTTPDETSEEVTSAAP